MTFARRRRASPPIPKAGGTDLGPRTAGVPTADEVARAHLPFIKSVLFRRGVPAADVPDLVQDVLLRITERLPTFTPTEPLTAAESLRLWIFALCVLRAGTRRRSLRRAGPVVPLDEMLEVLPSDTPDAGTLLEHHEQLELLQRLVADLPPPRRAVVLEHDIEGHSIAELARAQGLSEATLWNRRRLAHRDLRLAKSRLTARDRRLAAPVLVALLEDRGTVDGSVRDRVKVGVGAVVAMLAAAVVWSGSRGAAEQPTDEAGGGHSVGMLNDGTIVARDPEVRSSVPDVTTTAASVPQAQSVAAAEVRGPGGNESRAAGSNARRAGAGQQAPSAAKSSRAAPEEADRARPDLARTLIDIHARGAAAR